MTLVKQVEKTGWVNAVTAVAKWIVESLINTYLYDRDYFSTSAHFACILTVNVMLITFALTGTEQECPVNKQRFSWRSTRSSCISHNYCSLGNEMRNVTRNGTFMPWFMDLFSICLQSVLYCSWKLAALLSGTSWKSPRKSILHCVLVCRVAWLRPQTMLVRLAATGVCELHPSRSLENVQAQSLLF